MSGPNGRGVGFDPSFRQAIGSVWLRGDGLKQSAGIVTAWADRFGNYPNAVPATTGPGYTSADPQYGMRPTSAWLAASALAMTLTSLSIAQPNTVYFVGHISNNSANAYEGGITRQIIGATASNFWSMLGLGGSTLTSTVAAAAPAVVCAAFNGAASALYVNTSQLGVLGSTGATTESSLRIGSAAGGAGAITGTVAELIILPGVDTASQRAAMFGYLAWYYSLPGVA